MFDILCKFRYISNLYDHRIAYFIHIYNSYNKIAYYLYNIILHIIMRGYFWRAETQLLEVGFIIKSQCLQNGKFLMVLYQYHYYQ